MQRGADADTGRTVRRRSVGSAWSLRLILAAALGFGTAAGAAAQDVGIEIGARPDAVQLEDLDGNSVDLASIVGKKPVLLEFWATWCSVCRALEPKLKAAHEHYGARVEFVLVAVGVNQNPRSIKRHLEERPLPGRVLWDGAGRAVRAYMAPNTSYIVVLDAAGRVVYTGTGEDQDIAAAVARAIDSSG